MKMRVKVIPRAKKEGLVQLASGGWKARVKAQAERGKANASLVAMIARTIGVKKRQVEITGGWKTREKTIEIHE